MQQEDQQYALTPFFDILREYETPDQRMALLKEVLAEDAPYRKMDIAAQQQSTALRTIRVRQAEHLHTLMQEASDAIRMNSFFLGSLLIEALDRRLHTYLGYDSLDQWCHSMNISKNLQKEAILLAEIWPLMKQLGYPISAVVDGLITSVKARAIRAIGIHRPEEMKEQRIRLYREQILGESPEAALSDEQRHQIEKEIARLPSSERQRIHTEVEERHRDVARQHVEHIRQLSPEDFLTERQELRGLGTKPYICLNAAWHHGQLSGTFHFPCELAEALAMSRNHYTLVVRLAPDTESARSMSEIGEELLLRME